MQANAVRIECYFSKKIFLESHQFQVKRQFSRVLCFFGRGANYSKQYTGLAGGILPT